MEKDSCIIYLHGTLGNADEANQYLFLSDKYDVIGLHYYDGNPWERKDGIIEEFIRISSNYKHVNIIANSMGAFYAIHYLYKFNIEKAFFISPLVDMKNLLNREMKKYKVSLEELESKKYIDVETWKTLSYDFYQENCLKDNWKFRTHIAYCSKDRVIPYFTIKNFINSHQNSTISIFNGGEHWFHTDEQMKFLKKEMIDFFTL